MTEFRIWAPKAQQVELDIAGERYPMTKDDRNWWKTDVHTTNGITYGFRIDGADPIPDPRSGWQPQGVHKPSKIVDHNNFRWKDQSWQSPPLSSAIIYEIHTGTFTPAGTFDAIIDKLGYLVDLGVTHIELIPVAEFPGTRGWGDDGGHLYAPYHSYGGPEGFKHLVNACHMQGLAVILDVVYNHFGPEGNYLARLGPYFTHRYITPWGDAINFDDKGCDEVRRFFCDNALMWFRDYHVDALRLDAVHAYRDNSAINIMEQLAREVKILEAQIGRHLSIIAESDLNDTRVIQPWEVGGYGIHAQWSDDFHHALHSIITGEKDSYYADYKTLSDLAQTIQQGFLYAGRYSEFRQRCHGRPVKNMAGYRFVSYMQNHDQIGNRALGQRIHHLANLNRVKIGAALLLTSPFIPMLFQGEEWASSSPFLYFTGYNDPTLADAVREGRRKDFIEYGWNPTDVPDPQDSATFEASKLKWNEIGTEPHASMLDWYRKLIRLRKTLPCLRDGDLNVLNIQHDENAQWLIIERGFITIVVNFATQPRQIPIKEHRPKKLLLASHPDSQIHDHQINLPPESVVILSR